MAALSRMPFSAILSIPEDASNLLAIERGIAQFLSRATPLAQRNLTALSSIRADTVAEVRIGEARHLFRRHQSDRHLLERIHGAAALRVLIGIGIVIERAFRQPFP